MCPGSGRDAANMRGKPDGRFRAEDIQGRSSGLGPESRRDREPVNQTQLLPVLAAVRALSARCYGTAPDLTDLSRIVLMSRELHGYTHELVMDLTCAPGPVHVTETVEDIPVDDGWLDDPVTWLNEADPDEMRRPSIAALRACRRLDSAW